MPRKRTTEEEIGDLARRLYLERLAPLHEDHVVASSPPLGPDNMPRRRVTARTQNNLSDPDPAKREYGDPVYTWAFQSSQPRGGVIVTYETRLEVDGVLRCNCMGWIFQRKDKDGKMKPRHCKHLDAIQGEVSGIMRRFRAGEQLDILNPEVAATLRGSHRGTGRIPSDRQNISNTPQSDTADSAIRHGRVIQL